MKICENGTGYGRVVYLDRKRNYRTPGTAMSGRSAADLNKPQVNRFGRRGRTGKGRLVSILPALERPEHNRIPVVLWDEINSQAASVVSERGIGSPVE